MKYIWGVFTAISLALFSCGSGSKESALIPQHYYKIFFLST